MLNSIEFYGDGFGRDVISADSPKIKRIEGDRPLRVRKIRRNPATIASAKFLSTSTRVRTGLSGLPCSPSGWSEKRPSIIHDCAFFKNIFFIFLAPTVRIPLLNVARTHTHTEKRTHFRNIEDR